MKLKSKTTATLLIAIFVISAFAFAVNAADVDLLVTVTPGQYTLTVDTIGTGNVYLDNVPGQSDGTIYTDPVTVPVDTVIELCAWPGLYPGIPSDWKFDHWEGDVQPQENPPVPLYPKFGQVTMDENQEVTAVFVLKIVSIDLTWDGHPNPIDFGTVIAGTLSGTETITVENNGDYIVDVSMTIHSDTEHFYEAYLVGDESPVIGLGIGATSDVDLHLDVPLNFDPSGSPYTGTLLFTAVTP